MIDLHFHLLPGVDDGPATLEDSVELAARAVAEGTRAIVATPHVRPDFVTDVWPLRGIARGVERALAEEGIEVAVACGAELGHQMVGRLDQAELDAIALGPPGARWLLLEAPFGGLDEAFAAAAAELRDRGFGVVIAHPERALEVMDGGAAALRDLLAEGDLLQLSAASLTGRHGGAARDAAARLLLDGSATVLASDAHGALRPPALVAGLAAAEALGLPAAAARRLVTAAPSALLRRGLRSRLPAG